MIAAGHRDAGLHGGGPGLLVAALPDEIMDLDWVGRPFVSEPHGRLSS